MKKSLKNLTKICAGGFIACSLLLCVYIIWLSFQIPSNYRDWREDQSTIVDISFVESGVYLQDIRDFRYGETPTDFISGYINRDLLYADITDVYYVISPFSSVQGIAHTMLVFEFSDGFELVISPEVRREKGEKFSAIRGIFAQYEMIYIVGTADDLVDLRLNHQKDPVYKYPLRLSQEKKQALFISLLEQTAELIKEPQWYNTITNSCSSSLLRHANELRDDTIRWNYKVLLPSYSDEILYNLGLIDTELSLGEAREEFRLDDSKHP